MRRALVVGLAVVLLLSAFSVGSVYGKENASPIFVPLVCSEAPFAPPGLVITMLRHSTSDEYVTITNMGQGKVALDGHRLESEPDQVFSFPSMMLAPGATVTVHSGPDALDDPPGDLLWTRRYMWNDNGDVARLYDDAGMLLDVWAY